MAKLKRRLERIINMDTEDNIYKVVSIISNHSIAIKIPEGLVSEGDIFKVIGTRIKIQDPDSGELLGNYTIYKDSFEVTEVYEEFCIATKFEHENQFQISIIGKKKVGRINADYSDIPDYNEVITVGDQAELQE
jgi:hypothetical protein